MSDKTVGQFRWMSLIGGVTSIVGVGGLFVVSVSTMTFAVAALLTRMFVLLCVVGLVQSSIALVLARKGSVQFWIAPRAYVAACLGVVLPSALVLLHFVKILQRLMLQAA
ncbi:MAG: hypothetical protein H8E66_10960 [Planctomycetes bacterium]|nr:hypothetical protein [Planctomycetota bacterium]